MKAYLAATQSRSYNFIFSGILLILYEASIVFLKPPVVNGVDVWFQYFLRQLPNGSYVVSGGLLIAGLVIWYMDRKEGLKIEPRYFLWMFAESAVYALLIYQFLPQFMGKILHNQVGAQASLTLLQKIGLSFGAGFYEELMFRLIVVYAITYFIQFTPFMILNPWMRGAMVAAISAFLFSAAHYVGQMGDELELYSFVYRWLFGVIMSGLLILRNFGITAWTHGLYDVLVFSIPVILK
jgi:hypothetical protein